MLLKDLDDSIKLINKIEDSVSLRDYDAIRKIDELQNLILKIRNYLYCSRMVFMPYVKKSVTRLEKLINTIKSGMRTDRIYLQEYVAIKEGDNLVKIYNRNFDKPKLVKVLEVD